MTAYPGKGLNIRNHQRARSNHVTEPVLAKGLEVGDVGARLTSTQKAFEVEFATLDGKTGTVVTVEAFAVRSSHSASLPVNS
jgi:hypothetical protein